MNSPETSMEHLFSNLKFDVNNVKYVTNNVNYYFTKNKLGAIH